MKDPKLMTCGHAANATCEGKPACVICNCTEVSKEKPSLKGRNAKCGYCQKTVDSNWNLPFFELSKNHNRNDRYYCGCRGWN